jgi:hypothetical protein
MKIKYKFILVLALLYSFSVNSFSQNLPYMHFKMLKNDTLHFYMKANALPPVEIVPVSFGTLNNVLPGTGNSNPLTFHLKYIPDNNFTGRDRAVLEYRGNPGNSLMDWAIKRTIVDIDVLNSIIKAQSDIVFINTNSQGDTIDILANDSTTADSLFISDILNVNNGAATLYNNKVIFKPDTNFTGTTYFNYKINDNLGSSAIGHVIINVADQNITTDTLYYQVTNTNTLPIILNEAGFEIDSGFAPQLGDINFDNDPELVYTPDVDSTGTDEFHFINSSDTIVIYVEIFDGKDDGGVVIDDNVYTGLNTEVSFNVIDNDYKKNYFSLSHTDPENGTLQYNGQGNFTYTPDDEFNGVDEFTYTLQLSFNYFQSATVKIYVDNFYPNDYENYNIYMSKNSQFVLSYDIPINGYSFNIHSQPIEGTVDIYNDWDTVYVNCEDVIGQHFIVYTPPADYIGNDRFEIEYCPPNDSCIILKVNPHIYDEQSDTTCACAAASCIWPGDTDNDGKVNAKDILPIAMYLGNTGPQRGYSTINWLGLNAEAWNLDQIDNGINLNHADADGNGKLTTNDSIAILDHFNKLHNIYSERIVEEAEFPMFLVPDQTEVDSGDVLTLYIIVGDDDNPAKDINGIAYTLSVNSYLADSASLHHEFYTDSWLANGSASMQLSKQYQDGQVDAAFSRIGFSGITGIGAIATCDFIVEDDIDGLKRCTNLKKIPFDIKISNITIANGAGNTSRIPDIETTVYLNLKGNNNGINEATDIILYPNPTKDNVNIFLDGNDNISGYRIYNSLGMLMSDTKTDESKKANIDLSTFNNGIYLIEIYTQNNKKYIRKIEIVK